MNKKQKGFTLIEILVAMAVFALILGILSEVFVSASKSQRRTLNSQEILDQTSYLMEYISRSIRMAQKDVSGDCVAPGFNFEKTHLGLGIKFKNYQDVCQEFYLENDILKEEKNGVVFDLTSANLKVAAFNLGADDSWSGASLDQPRVTFFLEIQGKENAKIKIQTTITQRNLNE